MPELPDVENFGLYFRKHALRQVIEGVSVADQRVLRKLAAERLRWRVIGAYFCPRCQKRSEALHAASSV